ncbi:gpi anchored protein [Rutstroemia sp. NJR-2017a BVV2]|nr:gpi anchored protein [Rutstroemia sp. NJR-2017a BVV2]
MFTRIFTILALATSALVQAHTVITYPGWRGDNLITNDTFPYGMQWMYPCGGMPTTTNRTLWPIKGGAIAVQPGWFQGHATAFFYINLGFGTDGPGGGPQNMSFPMTSVFQIVGPDKNPYPGTFCLPQVPLPANTTVNVGDNATIQVVETALHGAALYSCVDITFAEPEDVAEVNSSNCFNSSHISFANVYTINDANTLGTSGAPASRTFYASSLAAVLGAAVWVLL